MDPREVRTYFPSLSDTVYGKPLVYLDNAATAMRPLPVMDRLSQLAAHTNANIHRAVHYLSSQATQVYEQTRAEVCAYLHASSPEEIIFTSGTTAGVNLVAYTFGEAFVGEGDEVLVSVAEHHSNLVPWQLLCQRKKATLKVLDIEPGGELSPERLRKLISRRTKIVAITQISNVLGVVNPAKEMIAVAHEMGVPVLLDGAQGVVHCPVDVQDLDCDFYVFSGHKVYAATGTGVLYGKKRWLDAMPPFLSGGEMIGTVRIDKTTFAPLPQKFEAGTQNFNAIPTLSAALTFKREVLDAAGMEGHLSALRDYVYEALLNDERITLYGVPHRTQDKVPVFSFTVAGVHHEDLALLLDKMGVAVRSGQMCAEPLMDRLGVTGMLRASFAPYNTLSEAEYFVQCLHRAIAMLQ